MVREIEQMDFKHPAAAVLHRGPQSDARHAGPGVRPEDVERLKQPFTRAEDSRARSDGVAGAGLGLAIVERIARLHGGRFELLPREGGGTIARVRLPLKG